MVEITEALLLPLMAIAMLAFVWLWKQSGFKSKNGLKFIAISAAWLIFYHAFNVFAAILVGTGFESWMSMIGQWVGGTLAWLFAFLGAVFLVMENFKA